MTEFNAPLLSTDQFRMLVNELEPGFDTLDTTAIAERLGCTVERVNMAVDMLYALGAIEDTSPANVWITASDEEYKAHKRIVALHSTGIEQIFEEDWEMAPETASFCDLYGDDVKSSTSETTLHVAPRVASDGNRG